MLCGGPFGVLSCSVLSSRVSKGIWFEDLDQDKKTWAQRWGAALLGSSTSKLIFSTSYHYVSLDDDFYSKSR